MRLRHQDADTTANRAIRTKSVDDTRRRGSPVDRRSVAAAVTESNAMKGIPRPEPAIGVQLVDPQRH